MAYDIKRLGKFALPAAAMTLSVFGLAAGSSAHSTKTDASDASDAPLNCEIAVNKGRYGHTFEGVIQANTNVQGSYELSFSKRDANGSSMIRQSGTFNVPAGETQTLGQATFGGLPPEAVDAELTLRWNGHKMTCSNQPSET